MGIEVEEAFIINDLDYIADHAVVAEQTPQHAALGLATLRRQPVRRVHVRRHGLPSWLTSPHCKQGQPCLRCGLGKILAYAAGARAIHSVLLLQSPLLPAGYFLSVGRTTNTFTSVSIS